VQVPPTDPTSAPTRGSNTGKTQLEMNFASYTADGGSAILAYGLEIDSGSGFVVKVDALVNTALITSSINSG
jgi:hypothetical protein